MTNFNLESESTEDLTDDDQPLPEEDFDLQCDSLADLLIPNEEEHSVDQDAEDNDVDSDPLYPGAAVTLGAFMLLLAIFTTKYNLIGEATEQLLKILALALPHGHKLCASLYEFKLFFKNLRNPLVRHYYCNYCLGYIENTTVQSCPYEFCKSKFSVKNASYFIEMPLEHQIQNLFAQKDFYGSLGHRFKRKPCDNTYEDIYDGKLYKELSENNGILSFQENISFTFNTDGAPVFKSSKTAIWPIYLVINELPYKQRMQKENMILASLWYGSKKPSMGTFLKPFLKSLQKMNEGIKCSSPERGQFLCRGLLLCGTADLPARSLLCNHVQYNGAFSCWKCEQEGETASVGRGHARIFPFQSEEPKGPMRTKKNVLENARIAVEDQHVVMGKPVKGSNTSRRSPRSVTGKSSEGSLNGSGSNTSRRSPRSVTGKSSEGSLNGSASRIYSQSQRSSISKGSPCSINGTHEDLNENTKREISDPAIEQSVNEVSHYAHVGEYISQKYEKQQMCDISFKLGDKLFPAHKLVLASQSPLFAEVFEREHFSKEPVAPKIFNVRGVSEEALVSFLAFIYTGRLDFNTVYWRDVMKLALVFKVEQIRKLYLRKIEQMKCEDQLRLLPNMAQLQAVEISEKIIRNISTNFLKIKECPAFFDLDVETLCLILSDENIMARSEFEIFSAAVSWFHHHDYEKRVQHLETIMRCVRFPLMTNKELFLCLRKFPILRQNQSCVNMITMANWARTSLELNEEDPLDIAVNKRDGVNSPQSVSDYINAKSSGSIEDEVEVEVTPMSQELAQDFNCHAGSPCMLLEQSPKVEQYRTSKCEATAQRKDSRSGNKRRNIIIHNESDKDSNPCTLNVQSCLLTELSGFMGHIHLPAKAIPPLRFPDLIDINPGVFPDYSKACSQYQI